MKKRKTETLKPTDAQLWYSAPPGMTVEWQVIPGDTNTIHVFTSPGAVFGFLAEEWERFTISWLSTRTCRLSVEVRRVEREIVVARSPARSRGGK